MTSMVVPQDVVDSQLAACRDGEQGQFTLTGTFKSIPGMGAVIVGDTVTKQGGAGYESTPAPAPAPAAPPASDAAMAVVKRKTY